MKILEKIVICNPFDAHLHFFVYSGIDLAGQDLSKFSTLEVNYEGEHYFIPMIGLLNKKEIPELKELKFEKGGLFAGVLVLEDPVIINKILKVLSQNNEL